MRIGELWLDGSSILGKFIALDKAVYLTNTSCEGVLISPAELTTSSRHRQVMVVSRWSPLILELVVFIEGLLS